LARPKIDGQVDSAAGAYDHVGDGLREVAEALGLDGVAARGDPLEAKAPVAVRGDRGAQDTAVQGEPNGRPGHSVPEAVHHAPVDLRDRLDLG
jgi:hypothetical protein